MNKIPMASFFFKQELFLETLRNNTSFLIKNKNPKKLYLKM